MPLWIPCSVERCRSCLPSQSQTSQCAWRPDAISWKLHVSWNHLTLYKPHTIFLRSVRSAPVQPTANFLVLLPRRCFWGQSLHKASSIANRCTNALYWPLTGNQTFSTVPLFPTCSTFLLGLGVNPTATFQMRGTDFLFEKRRACCPKKNNRLNRLSVSVCVPRKWDFTCLGLGDVCCQELVHIVLKTSRNYKFSNFQQNCLCYLCACWRRKMVHLAVQKGTWHSDT